MFGLAIIAFNGGLGQGKTLNMVAEGVKWLRERRVQVYTNMAGLKFPEAIYFDHIDEICDIGEGLVLLDEAGIVIPAQFWSELGRDLLVRFNQLRKHGLDLFYTAQREDGVNTNLREITSEFRKFHRHGPMVVCQKKDGIKAKQVSVSVKRMNPAFFGLYDTLETIAAHGGSTGRADLVRPLSRVAAAQSVRRARERQERVKSKQKPLMYCDTSGVWVPTRETKAAYLGLVRGGGFDPLLPWPDQVRQEMARTAWLALFGLKPADAPFDCTPESPWLKGYDPASVHFRRLEREEDRAADKLSILAERKRKVN